jgi:hypothetical protein
LAPQEIDANRYALSRVKRVSFEDAILNEKIPSQVERTCRYYALAGVDLADIPHPLRKICEFPLSCP